MFATLSQSWHNSVIGLKELIHLVDCQGHFDVFFCFNIIVPICFLKEIASTSVLSALKTTKLVTSCVFCTVHMVSLYMLLLLSVTDDDDDDDVIYSYSLTVHDYVFNSVNSNSKLKLLPVQWFTEAFC